MVIDQYRRPVLFYGLSTAVSWTFWFGAAYVSHLVPAVSYYSALTGVLGLAGLISPMVVAFFLIYHDGDLRNDLRRRFFNFRGIKPVYLWLTAFLMLGSLLLAQALSLLFGYSAAQFSLAGHFSFSSGILPVWFLLLIAPFLEELAWHSYGTDCLRRRFSLFTTSLIFAVFWALWHLPLSFIKGYYQSNLVDTGLLHALNFPLSLIPCVLLMNWLYYKTGRNVLVTIVFHTTAVYFNEIFATHPDSKIIQTLLLMALAVYLLLKERAFFFRLDDPG
jgi:membrane protease YdiL (CAAX protease family)